MRDVIDVILPPHLQAALDAIPETRAHPLARPWTIEEDAFLLAARARGALWSEITAALGVSSNTVRARWRVLRGE